MAFPPISILRKERPLKINECGHTYSHDVQRFGTFCPIGWGRWTEAFIYALSAAETSPLFPASQPQTKPCFPAASNALALPGGNSIFTSTPTERITHYTLQAKSCAKWGTAPFGYPHNKQALCPCWEHSAVCCQQPVSRSACSSL